MDERLRPGAVMDGLVPELFQNWDGLCSIGIKRALPIVLKLKKNALLFPERVRIETAQTNM